MSRTRSGTDVGVTDQRLPLLSSTPRRWGELATARLELFLADHAVCEQQAALAALDLVARYPEDSELVERMTALAAEELSHLRRVAGLLRRRGLHPARRRPNPYVQRLRRRIHGDSEQRLKIDRLLVGALIEARSCERFTLISATLDESEAEVATLLAQLGPAERRHWRLFHRLAARGADADWFDDHWREWLRYESRINSELGVDPRVHG